MKQGLQFIKVVSFVVLSIVSLSAQVNFEGSRYHINERKIPSFIPKVFTDMNGDFRDDLLLTNETNVFQYAYSQQSDSLYLNAQFDRNTGKAWANGAADLDNDGIAELFFAGFYNDLTVYKKIGETYTLSQQLNLNIFAQAFNIVDINNDGYVDVFICNDDGLSSIFINDGTGILINQSDMIDMTTIPASDNSGNYGSIWTDIDNDGDSDLYLVKCRLGIESDIDPRRVNALFINDGNGNFTEEAAIRNLAIGAQSWAADFADVDRDGDLDLFLVNHEYGNQLLYNDGNGIFTEDNAFRSLVPENGLGYQALATDIDNNGWVDLIVAGGRQIIYYNNGGTFTAVTDDQTGLIHFGSAAYGDVNQDGFIDLLAGANGLAGISTEGDQLYINQGNDNHFIKISLQGVETNRQGIGAIVSINTSEGSQMRYCTAGTSYSVQNTGTQHFGLGQLTSVTSVAITWPTGSVDTYTDLLADQHYLAVEGNCLELLPELSTAINPVICTDSEMSPIELTASTPAVIWNTGETSQSILVSQEGTFQAFLSGECSIPSNILKVHGVPLRDDPVINVENDIILCDGDQFSVAVLNYNQVLWQDGSEALEVAITEPTILQAKLETECGDFVSEAINVDFVDPVGNDIADSQVAGDVVLETGYPYTKWYSDDQGTDLVGEGSILAFSAHADTTLYYSIDPDILPPTATVALDFEEETLFDNTTNLNGLIFINATRDLRMKSVDVNVLQPGVRELTLTRSDNVEIGRVSVDLQDLGRQTVEVNWEMEAMKNYRISTDADVNMSSFGTPHPQFSISFNPEYPIFYDTWLTVTNSTFPSVYFYFYNWVVEELHESCSSPIYAYDLTVTASNTQEISFDQSSLIIVPNPVSTGMQLSMEELNLSGDNQLEIFTALGKQVFKMNNVILDQSIDVNQWPSGQYIVKLTNGKTQYIATFSKN